MKIFVTGVNGFIGSHFLEMALAQTDWEIQGFDLADNNITQFLDNPRFSMKKGDIFKEEAWLNEQIKECDVLLPLIGIARPAYYITRPLWTFELDFEQNLKMVRKCAEYGKRVIFPSTSEVYGMPDPNNKVMDEDNSNLILWNPHIHAIVTLGGFNKNYKYLNKKYFHVNSIAGQWKKLVIDIVKSGNYKNKKLKKKAQIIASSLYKKDTRFFFDVAKNDLKNKRQTKSRRGGEE